MKTSRILMLLFMLASFFACDKDDDAISEADFEVLGITNVMINGKQFTVSDGVLIDVSNDQNITVTGSEFAQSTKTALIEYAIFTSGQEDFSCTVISKFSDVSVSVNVVSSGDISTGTVKISREGYDEEITYKFVQKVLD